MNTCIHVCTQLRLHTQHIHVHIYIYLCVCTCIYVCLITCIYTRTHTHTQKHIQLYIHLSIYMFTCTCVCVYRCIYKFIYISLCQFYQKKLPVWTVPQNSSFVATRIPTTASTATTSEGFEPHCPRPGVPTLPCWRGCDRRAAAGVRETVEPGSGLIWSQRYKTLFLRWNKLARFSVQRSFFCLVQHLGVRKRELLTQQE